MTVDEATVRAVLEEVRRYVMAGGLAEFSRDDMAAAEDAAVQRIVALLGDATH